MNSVVIILCKLWEVGEEMLYSGHFGTTKNPISPFSNLYKSCYLKNKLFVQLDSRE